MDQLKDCITKICDEIRRGNYPNEASVSQLEMACQVAGLRFGKDLIVNLGD